VIGTKKIDVDFLGGKSELAMIGGNTNAINPGEALKLTGR